MHGETTTAHAVLNGLQYYHQDWAHAAAFVTVPPLRLDPNTPNYLLSLLGKSVESLIFNNIQLYGHITKLCCDGIAISV